MPNPFDPIYLFTARNVFGPFAWAFLVIQVAVLGAGGYFYFLRHARNVLQEKRFRQLGIALASAGALGLVFALLRVLNVGPFLWPFWFWLALAIEVGIGGYAFYYFRVQYRKELSTLPTKRGSSSHRAASKTGSQGSAASEQGEDAEEQSGTRSTRRTARQRRKRKSRS
jgi:hypothetical protein